MTRPSSVVRAAIAGAASGARSQSVLAACALTPAGPARIDRWLHRPAARRAQVLAAAGELIGDKLPVAPSRTEPPGLAARVVEGAGAAWIIAARRGDAAVPAAVIAAAAAAGWSFAGVRGRAAAARRFGGDLPGALAEDVFAIAAAALVTRRSASLG